MRAHRHNGSAAGLIILGAMLFAGDAHAQSRIRTVEEPEWFKLRITQVEAGVYAEGNYETTTYGNSGRSVTYDRIFVGPLMGFDMAGSVYHPYFLRYHANAENAFGWSEQTVSSSTTTIHREGMDYRGRFQGGVDMFANKPFDLGFSGGYGRSYRKYDFFNQSTVDSWNYGTRASYRMPGLNFRAFYTHSEEKSVDTDLPTASTQDLAGFDVQNERNSGNTTLGYTFNRYNRSDFGTASEAVDHSVTVSDAEKFGSHDQFRLQTGASYTRRDANVQPNDQYSGYGSLFVEHQPTLHSSYLVNYDGYSADAFRSDSYSGEAGLQHQLYESLGSSLVARFSDTKSSDQFSSGYSRSYGGGIAESYTKRLTSDHVLRIYNSISVDHREQKGTSTVVNERHSLSGTDDFFLNLPGVDASTIVVKDAAAVQIFSPVIDYEIIPNGSRIQIRLRPGTTIPPNSTVLVDYHAEPSPAGDYESMSEYAQVRLDLWNNFWGVYARFNSSFNNAPEELRVPELRIYTLGTDVRWRWLRAGAECEVYDSDLSEYRAARLYQSFTFRLDRVSSLGVNLSQTFRDYISADRQEQDYRFVALYRRSLAGNLRMTVDGGVDYRTGTTVEQTLATFRPNLDYMIGRTSVGLAYNYEYSLFLNSEERNRHLFLLRVRRTF